MSICANEEIDIEKRTALQSNGFSGIFIFSPMEMS
jgi:hypothetical protein